jgi:hypothetical protein
MNALERTAEQQRVIHDVVLSKKLRIFLQRYQQRSAKGCGNATISAINVTITL